MPKSSKLYMNVKISIKYCRLEKSRGFSIELILFRKKAPQQSQ